MLRLDRVSRLTIGAAVAWGVFGGVDALRASGAGVPAALASLSTAIAVALAAAHGILSAAAIWRGPSIISFGREESVLCGPAHAEIVRNAAQLRGTMGGAGHVHPLRLLVPAVGWGLAAILGAAEIADPHAGGAARPVIVLVVTALVASALPARPFYYREAIGGAVLVSPRSTLARLDVPIGEAADTPSTGIVPLDRAGGES